MTNESSLYSFAKECLICSAKDEQSPHIIALIKDSTSRVDRYHIDTDFSSPELLNPATSAKAKGGDAIIATFEGKIVAFAMFHRAMISFIIDHFYISFPFQNKGLGYRMMLEIIDRTLSQKINQEDIQANETTNKQDNNGVNIEIWIDNKLSESHSFFENLGFVKSGEQRRRVKKYPHLSDDERDFSSAETCFILSLSVTDTP